MLYFKKKKKTDSITFIIRKGEGKSTKVQLLSFHSVTTAKRNFSQRQHNYCLAEE